MLSCLQGVEIMEKTLIYHGSKEKVTEPEIKKTKFTKDFSWGFYCTFMNEQAIIWATRIDGHWYLHCYEYIPIDDLNIKVFDKVSYEWLDFIAECRNGKVHTYDVVEGPMADDTIYNYVEDYLDGNISKEAFMELAKFKKPTHQISFHSLKALSCLKYLESKEVTRDE